jgi:hypothetical protein
MKTFREFVLIAEDRMGERLGKMSDADFEQFLKGRTPGEAKTYRAKRATYTSSGSAGQGVRDAAQQARQGQPFNSRGRAGSPGNSQTGYATSRNAGGGRPTTGATPSGGTSTAAPSGGKFRIPRPTAGQAAVGALNVGLGALDYKQRRDAGQTRTQAGSGAVASSAGGQAGWMVGAKGGAALGSRIAGPRGALVGGVLGGITGSIAGSSGASALSDKLTGVNKAPTEKDYEKARQRYGMTQSRKVASQAKTYGATKGSALTGIGGPAKVDTKAGTLTSKGKTVKLASTQLVRDPKTGQQRVGDLAYKGGQAVYLARPSVASRDTGLGGAIRNISRATGIGGQKERDAAAAKKEYKTALKNTQTYTKGLGISTKSSTAQKLPGYGTAPKPAAKPAPKPQVAGGGMGGARGSGSSPSVKK